MLNTVYLLVFEVKFFTPSQKVCWSWKKQLWFLRHFLEILMNLQSKLSFSEYDFFVYVMCLCKVRGQTHFDNF